MGTIVPPAFGFARCIGVIILVSCVRVLADTHKLPDQEAPPASRHAKEEGSSSEGRDEAKCAFRDGVFLHGLRTRRDVALTFDACPTRKSPGFAADVVDYLSRENIPATLFLSGRWARTHAAALKQLADVPAFEMALHSQSHRHLNGAGAASIQKEIDDGRTTLQELGVSPQPLFRPPYGEMPSTLMQAAQGAGVTAVLWDVAPGDPDPHQTPAMLERSILQRTRGGSIIVLHVNGRGVGTAAAVPVVVAGLRSRGFNFVTVGALLRACDAGSPNAGGNP